MADNTSNQCDETTEILIIPLYGIPGIFSNGIKMTSQVDYNKVSRHSNHRV